MPGLDRVRPQKKYGNYQDSSSLTASFFPIRPDDTTSTVTAVAENLDDESAPESLEQISYDKRNLRITTNLIAIIHKMTKNKAHRILSLVSWKSSAVLKRILRLRSYGRLHYYSLKILKSQVPFLGRKWRNANMRVIGLIYFHLRPRLHESYLSGEIDTNDEKALVGQFLDLCV